MIYPIRYYGDPLLRKRAAPVKKFDSDLARLAADMIETMYAADGVGLAAPQIGLDKRLFVALALVSPDGSVDNLEIANYATTRVLDPLAAHAALTGSRIGAARAWLARPRTVGLVIAGLLAAWVYKILSWNGF